MTNYTSSLETFKLNGITPFWSPADAADEQLSQAHALLTVLAGANDLCEEADADSADRFHSIRHQITARALDGVATLVALAQHQTDVVASRHFAERQHPEWAARAKAHKAAKARLDAHCAIPSPEFDEPSLDVYEAKTDELASAHADIFLEMVLTPAPDQAALAYKLEAYSQVVGGDSWDRGAEMVAQFAADAKRFAKDA